MKIRASVVPFLPKWEHLHCYEILEFTIAHWLEHSHSKERTNRIITNCSDEWQQDEYCSWWSWWFPHDFGGHYPTRRHGACPIWSQFRQWCHRRVGLAQENWSILRNLRFKHRLGGGGDGHSLRSIRVEGGSGTTTGWTQGTLLLSHFSKKETRKKHVNRVALGARGG